jgi:hypothetical protein
VNLHFLWSEHITKTYEFVGFWMRLFLWSGWSERSFKYVSYFFSFLFFFLSLSFSLTCSFTRQSLYSLLQRVSLGAT